MVESFLHFMIIPCFYHVQLPTMEMWMEKKEDTSKFDTKKKSLQKLKEKKKKQKAKLKEVKKLKEREVSRFKP